MSKNAFIHVMKNLVITIKNGFVGIFHFYIDLMFNSLQKVLSHCSDIKKMRTGRSDVY